ncbi:hypothetical protein ACWEWG_00290 [Streptomyces sp. NPDC003758]
MASRWDAEEAWSETFLSALGSGAQSGGGRHPHLCDRTAVPSSPLVEGLHTRLARDADDAGILDVAYLTIDSPGPTAAGRRIEGAKKRTLRSFLWSCYRPDR